MFLGDGRQIRKERSPLLHAEQIAASPWTPIERLVLLSARRRPSARGSLLKAVADYGDVESRAFEGVKMMQLKFWRLHMQVVIAPCNDGGNR